ncbi:MAG: hypothetical protein ABIW84_00340 [Ilumatobacteraceae bacterium]
MTTRITAAGGGSSGGSALTVKDEGSTLSAAVTSVDFVGAGVTATGTTAVTVTIPSSVTPWTEITGATTAAVNNYYLANHASTQVVLTLPGTAAVGNVIGLANKGAAGFKLAQPSGVTVHFGSLDTTAGTGGFITFNKLRDSIFVVCTVANTDWTVFDACGTLNVT